MVGRGELEMRIRICSSGVFVKIMSMHVILFSSPAEVSHLVCTAACRMICSGSREGTLLERSL